MKCSLLTLSTFIDGELAPPRYAEVDAHLVGCTRCSAGAATLREEKARVGQLARVTVDPGSAQLMLEQVGIVLDSVADRSPAIPPPPSAPPDAHRPWQGGRSGRALPWTPRRPEPAAALPWVPEVDQVDEDLQPDLPLEGMRSTPPSWHRVVEDDPAHAPSDDSADHPGPAAVVAALAEPGHAPAPVDEEPPPLPRGQIIPDPDPPAAVADWVDADEEWLNAVVAPDSWEEDLPPAAAATPPPAEPSDPPGELDAPMSSSPPGPPSSPLRSPPTRLASASGPAALWARVRDAVTVRLALSRGGDALEDSMEIISGAPSPRGAELQGPRPAAPPVVTQEPATPHPAAPASPEVELNGVAGRARPAPVRDIAAAATPLPEPTTEGRPGVPPAPPVAGALPDMLAPSGWNAFAASSYAHADLPVDEAPPAAKPRPIGRHTRAVARERVSLATRLSRGVLALASAGRSGAATVSTRLSKGAGRMSRTSPDRRLLAGVAGIAVIFVIALLIGHSSARPAIPIAARPSTASSAAHARPTAPAQSGAAAATAAPTPTNVQTFGAGDTGFQVARLRYGVQTSYVRVVFDIGPAGGAVSGTPRVSVAYSGATTVLVTLDGTLPAGSSGTPPPGKVISSVTLVSSTGGKSVYRFDLTRATTATAFYLLSPTRFVLDLH